MRQSLQNVTILLQNATFTTKADVYCKIRLCICLKRFVFSISYSKFIKRTKKLKLNIISGRQLPRQGFNIRESKIIKV